MLCGGDFPRRKGGETMGWARRTLRSRLGSLVSSFIRGKADVAGCPV